MYWKRVSVRVRTEVDHALAAHGLDGARIEEFKALNRQASLYDSYKANLDQVRSKLCAGEASFQEQLTERRNLVAEQRASFDRVIKIIRVEFEGRITASRMDDGNRGPLDRFLRDLGQRGITRWWNELEDQRKPAPMELLEHLRSHGLNKVNMSDAGAGNFPGATHPDETTRPCRYSL